MTIRNLSLIAASGCALLQFGAQFFAISVMASTIAAAPPRSFRILSGADRYNSEMFWQTVPPVTLVLLIAALVANWRTGRRGLLLVALALFIAGGVIAGAALEPMFADMIAQGYADTVDPNLHARAQRWLLLDWAVWAVGFVACLSLLVALARPETAGRGQDVRLNREH
jgi:hypothetical protein